MSEAPVTVPEDVEPYKQIIRKVVRDLGVDPDGCYNAEGNYWSLCKGSADVYISLFTIGDEKEKEWYVEFSSPVMKLPSENLLTFYRRLLEENAKYIAVRFSVREDTVWLDITRELAGLDENECRRSLTRIGETADNLDDELMKEFAEPDGAA